ncbi:MAG: AEC family transporter [Oscillospiraceae bacterium]|nr:AEC family transporter [Oscillospiraceae bacterium]
MLDIITRACCFVAVIVLGFVLRRIGFFKEQDFNTLSKIAVRITLPAAIVSNMAGRVIDTSLLSLTALGFFGGVLYMVVAFLLNIKKPPEKRAFEVLNLPGFNIGNFSLPFVQNFLGAAGVVAASLFDVGNAFICLGGAFGIASMIRDGSGFSMKRLGKALLTSVPFLAHVIMLLLCLLHISLPGPVVSFANIIAGGSAFVAMLMIGAGFKLEVNRSQIGALVKILGLRYGIAALLAVIFYFCLPFDLEVCQALVIVVFSPVGSAVPPFTRELKGDVGLSCAINSVSIVCSVVIIVTLLSVML